MRRASTVKEVAQNKQPARKTGASRGFESCRKRSRKGIKKKKEKRKRMERGGESESLAECLQEILLFDE